MEEFYDSLDCRLKVSGMVADSIMMGIVNSAMEEAYKKVCSKEGDLECLNEKSRFCELALMQLEWCLKFIQEEMDSYIVESSRERENLALDLTDARDRMQKRLEETELAIAEKDRELTDRLENESKLRQSLDSKEKELSTLRATLELERTKSERVQEFVVSNQIHRSNDRFCDFCEMKNYMDQQFWNIKQKLEDGRVHLTEGMHMDQSCGNPGKLEPAVLEPASELLEEGNHNLADMNSSAKSEGAHNGGSKRIGFLENVYNSEVEVLNSFPKMELNMAIEQMTADIDILKEMLEVAFEMMDNAISSSKLALMEEQWERTVEKETVALVLQGFLREIQVNFEAKSLDGKYKVPLGFSSGNWSALMDDITSLHNELEVLVLQNEVQSKQASSHQFGTLPLKRNGVNKLRRCSQSDSNLRFEELRLEDEAPKEDSVGHPHHHVSEMIRNHEHIIKKKTEEINWLQGEILREKGRPPLRKDKDLDTEKKLIPKKGNCVNKLQRCGKSDSSLRFEELFPLEDQPKEDTAAHHHHHVAEMIRNHEYIIEKKKDEINWLKGEILREKRRPPLKKGSDLNAVNKMIPKVISRLDHIIKENAELRVTHDDSGWVHANGELFLHKNLPRPKLADKEKAFCMSVDLPEKSHNVIAYPSVEVDSREKIRQLQQEREDLDMQAMIIKDTCMVLFEEFMQRLRRQLDSYNTEDLIRDDIYTVFFREMIREWNSVIESSSIESLIREEIYRIVLSEVVKDIEYTVNFTLGKHQEAKNQDTILEDLSSISNFPRSIYSGKKNSIQGLDSIPKFAEVKGNSTLNGSTELMQQYMHLGVVSRELEELDEHSIHSSKAKLKELSSSLGIEAGGWKEVQDQMISREGIMQDAEPTQWLADGEKQQTAFGSFVTSLTYFSEVITDFEHMMHEKIGVNILRLEEVNHQLDPLIQHVCLLRKREMLYRKAFIRRCYDLQTAEAEVDLLGDEVDVLLGLLQKIYISLDSYSPVLQHYPGIMDILRLIREELNGEAGLISRK
ncbi:uncharacterized protein LOC131245966 [Magnolia sinica]|uniref:uncharacterized protein LOC131245966 n=1 Tax=Magnolia sinica TaxID=86752 RepID=UPI002658CB48|nr:uncharacterized protein LOC131245966 [Magnolia sinica]XP_058101770.1 uncharacterized protein LOC131245966 [Magnolia sinica]